MKKGSSIAWPGAALALIVLAMTLHPGDTPWFFDMSRNFNLALDFNSRPADFLGMHFSFTPSPYGLKGTHGIRYGPLPIWLDQIFLSFTHNLLVMTVIRTILVAGSTSVALLWLAQLIGVSPWFAVLTMLSPWMWYYSRELWDNSLTVPTCALMLAGYLQFVKTHRAWAICLAVVFAALTGLVHLIAAPFVLVLLIHLLIYQRDGLWKVKWPLIGTVILMLAISYPYLHYVVHFHGSTAAENDSKWRGWVFNLLGAQHITGWKLGYFLEHNLHRTMSSPLRYAFDAARVITCIAFLACFAGMIMAIAPGAAALKGRSAAMFDHWCLIGLGTFVFQTIFDGVEQVYYHPHYYNTTWIVFVMFAWMGFSALARWFGAGSYIARLTVPIYAMALVFCLVIVRWQLIRDGGGKGDHYNALLGNQIEVAREVNGFSPDSPIDMQVSYWNDRKDTFPVLRRIVGDPPGDKPARRVVVKFRDAFAGDSRVIVQSYPLTADSAQ